LLYGAGGEGLENTSAQIARSLQYLTPAKRAGKPVLAIEYLDDPVQRASAYDRLVGYGFVPFFATHLLHRQPDP
jgi:endo-alpha-1,4-polygalactosaminidase (GH114 family)